MNEKPVRTPRNVKINPEALYRARGEWLEELIEGKVAREEKKDTKIEKTCGNRSFLG